MLLGTLAPMLACSCWVGSVLIALAILGGIAALGIWRHRRTLRDRSRTASD